MSNATLADYQNEANNYADNLFFRLNQSIKSLYLATGDTHEEIKHIKQELLSFINDHPQINNHEPPQVSNTKELCNKLITNLDTIIGLYHELGIQYNNE